MNQKIDRRFKLLESRINDLEQRSFEPKPKSNKKEVQKIIFSSGSLCPGDVVMMYAGLRDLMESEYGKWFQIDVRTTCNELFQYTKWITPLKESDPEVKVIQLEYPSIHTSNQLSNHFIHSFNLFMRNALNIKNIPYGEMQGFIEIGEEEKSWLSAMYEELGKDVPYWVIDVGWKDDFPAKQWDVQKWQKVVESLPEIYFAQIGANATGHNHPRLRGKNVIDFVAKTDHRQLIRLIWNSFGVLSPVSYPMVLSYAIPPHHRFKRHSRALIVVAGGREPVQWQHPPNSQFIHRCGMFSCNSHGGCWKSKLDGGVESCQNRIELDTGQTISKCMNSISAEEVIDKIKMYTN